MGLGLVGKENEETVGSPEDEHKGTGENSFSKEIEISKRSKFHLNFTSSLMTNSDRPGRKSAD